MRRAGRRETQHPSFGFLLYVHVPKIACSFHKQFESSLVTRVQITNSLPSLFPAPLGKETRGQREELEQLYCQNEMG